MVNSVTEILLVLQEIHTTVELILKRHRLSVSSHALQAAVTTAQQVLVALPLLHVPTRIPSIVEATMSRPEKIVASHVLQVFPPIAQTILHALPTRYVESTATRLIPHLLLQQAPPTPISAEPALTMHPGIVLSHVPREVLRIVPWE